LIKIGIPRGLWFYDYFPLWKAFYESLGAEVILSNPTNKHILDQGVKNTVDEACLPVKIFHGHIIDLKDRVDYIFVPRIMSVYKKEYICPKFCGLPELVRSSVKDIPPMIDTNINFNKSRSGLLKTIYEFGSYVTKDPVKIRKAYIAALKEYQKYKHSISEGRLPVNGEPISQGVFDAKNAHKRLALVGHSYLLYDNFGSMEIINKLRQRNVELLVPEMLKSKVINSYADTLEKKMFWSFGRRLLGTAIYLADNKNVDGVIYVSAFGCGIDSIVEDLFERRTRQEAEIPFLLITLDEHTGEAGVNTRLEAFIDMIDWRKKNEGHFSAFGKSICGN
jgi:predicted nucleotide-binding protein (sugar kinase/HSP70/actin superfamily)